MKGPALPSFKLLIAGALAAGIWVVRNEESGTPRPPEPVKERRTVEAARQAAPRPPEPVRKRKPAETVRTVSVRRPLEPVKAWNAVETALPATAARPPRRPTPHVTGSVPRPAAPVGQYRTSARVNLRGRAETAAPVIAVLEAGQPVRELVRSGQWRLVLAAGRKGWVHGDYLKAAEPPALRPKTPLPARTAAVRADVPPLRRP
jgi:Bacterial SH3 domain